MLYANDTLIYFTSNSVSGIQTQLSADLINIMG